MNQTTYEFFVNMLKLQQSIEDLRMILTAEENAQDVFDGYEKEKKLKPALAFLRAK